MFNYMGFFFPFSFGWENLKVFIFREAQTFFFSFFYVYVSLRYFSSANEMQNSLLSIALFTTKLRTQLAGSFHYNGVLWTRLPSNSFEEGQILPGLFTSRSTVHITQRPIGSLLWQKYCRVQKYSNQVRLLKIGSLLKTGKSGHVLPVVPFTRQVMDRTKPTPTHHKAVPPIQFQPNHILFHSFPAQPSH